MPMRIDKIKARKFFKKFPKYLTLFELKNAYLAFLYEELEGNKLKVSQTACCSIQTLNTMIDNDDTLEIIVTKKGRPQLYKKAER
jgi:hypothetical protein